MMWYESNEERIRRLEDELYRTRRAVLALLPPAIQELAETYHKIESRKDAYSWERALADAVIEIAKPLADETVYFVPRAYCPLCRNGSSEPYVEGFALPEGLRRHLLGEGNVYPCEVFSAVRELARDYWRPRVAEAEAHEKQAAEAEKDRRRETEDQFIVAPGRSPQLRDEGFYSYSKPRDDQSLAWAIDRLRQLGFVEIQDGRIRQFTKDYGEIVVYADPRELGRLNFTVFRNEQIEQRKSRRRWNPDQASFYLLDSWRNNLVEKLDRRVDDAKQFLLRRQGKGKV